MDPGASQGMMTATHRPAGPAVLAELAGSWITPRVDILGVGVSAIDMPIALELIDQWISNGEHQYVCVTGVHGIMESQRDPRLRDVQNRSGLTTPDGMPLVWAGHAAGARPMERVYGPDLMLALCDLASVRGFSSFFYGGRPGVADRLAQRLQDLYPGLKVAGTYSPPFREPSAAEDEDIVRLINEARPDVVWVGLGTPKQELWMAAHAARLDASVLIGVGAAFDIHAGLSPQAPRWTAPLLGWKPEVEFARTDRPLAAARRGIISVAEKYNGNVTITRSPVTYGRL